ncbi:CocE/NonD family hydrolase C-terminal non-catalytic domain-containing protein [Kribbella sp. NPDC050820]|uniref:CocE/NonD family hydrolase C-terminal non-catalytic domain-containing protein n=1 Tax=Kribbella sp. NPDC050820 TaxID=3155408 RepID=UPI0033EEF9BF
MNQQVIDQWAPELRRTLVGALAADGSITDAAWRAAFAAAPRHLFVPRFYQNTSEGSAQIDVSAGDQWLRTVYSDTHLVTKDDVTSSSTAPSLMATMLEALDLSGDETVLEVGTGIGYNAALLSERLGDTQVVSIGIDPQSVDDARRHLATAGYHPLLIDYGEADRFSGIRRTDDSTCEGESTSYDDACYYTVEKLTTETDHGIVSRGWIDAAHSKSLSKPTPLTPGQWTTVTVPLRAQDEVIPKGRILGLAVTLSDTEWTSPNDTGATIDIDLAGSKLNLPATSGKLTAPTKPQPIDVDITTPTHRPDLHDQKN